MKLAKVPDDGVFDVHGTWKVKALVDLMQFAAHLLNLLYAEILGMQGLTDQFLEFPQLFKSQ